MKKIYFFIFLLSSVISGTAQISITSTGSALPENFNTLATTGTNSSVPFGWAFLETGTGANTSYTASAGSSSPDTYSFGTGSTTDRAFGGLQTNAFNPTIGVSYINNTGTTITTIAVTYTGEEWYLAATGRTDRLAFQYSTNATSLNTGAWTSVADLDFYTPNTATIGAKDGNNVTNRTTLTSTVTGLNIPAGATFWFRWQDINVSGNDDGLGIDDFSATFTGNPFPPCSEPTAQPANLVLSSTPASVSGTFDLIPSPTTVENYFIVRAPSASVPVPADGISYTAGQPVPNGGTAIGISTDGNFTDNTVAPSTSYYYFIFAMNDQGCSGGPNYNQSSPLNGLVSTPAFPPCVTPSAAPTSLSLTSTNTTISGTFTAVAGANRYLVVISTNSAMSATPSNLTVYNPGDAFAANSTVVSYSSATSFSATGLTVATTYYLYIFSSNSECTGQPVYNTSSLKGNATTTNTTFGIPAGYYDAAAGLNCQNLKTALKNITNTGANALGYNSLWNLYLYSDMHRNDANNADIIWDMYTDNPTGAEAYTFTYGTNQCGSYSAEGDCYNREHSTPQAWFGEASPMVSDAHHIFPTDGKVNGVRSNYPYGEVTNVTYTSVSNHSKEGTGTNFGYSGIVFEPINAYKGDFARAALYMAVRYEDQIILQNWSNNANEVFLSTADESDPAKRRLQIYDAWYLKTLYKWHMQDPVSQKEIDRNDAIYYQEVSTAAGMKAQNNRNPFVDHPEYAALIFQCTGVVPVTLIDFTAQKIKSSVVLQWYATQESSFSRFDVERSVDGFFFNKIGDVIGQNLANYSFTDNDLPKASAVYYRLRMIDADGKSRLSKIAAVKIENNVEGTVYPNPASGTLNISLSEALKANANMIITDFAGRAVSQQSANANESILKVDVSRLPAGRYFVRIISNNQVINQTFTVAR